MRLTVGFGVMAAALAGVPGAFAAQPTCQTLDRADRLVGFEGLRLDPKSPAPLRLCAKIQSAHAPGETFRGGEFYQLEPSRTALRPESLAWPNLGMVMAEAPVAGGGLSG